VDRKPSLDVEVLLRSGYPRISDEAINADRDLKLVVVSLKAHERPLPEAAE